MNGVGGAADQCDERQVEQNSQFGTRSYGPAGWGFNFEEVPRTST
jgi:hypothetical protein